jgi:hypothetical protein
MVLHAVVYGVKHPKDKSVLLAAITLAYMVVFGHNMP